MPGRHRSTPQGGRRSVRKSAQWLLTAIALVLAPVAILALPAAIIYLVVARPHPPAYLLPLAIAVDCVLWIWLCGDLASTLLRKWSGLTPQLKVPVVGYQASQLGWVTAILLIAIGIDQGWARNNSPVQYVLFGFEFAFVLAWAAFRRVRDRRQNALLEARRAARQ
jgi:hypothetical protein